jgi:hypothetical protein
VSPSRDERKRRQDAADAVIETLSPQLEPPPMSRPVMPVPYAYPIPFGEPPAEPVTLVEGEIPWELRDED